MCSMPTISEDGADRTASVLAMMDPGDEGDGIDRSALPGPSSSDMNNGGGQPLQPMPLHRGGISSLQDNKIEQLMVSMLDQRYV